MSVDADRKHAFAVFTQGFDTWWMRSHHIPGDGSRGRLHRGDTDAQRVDLEHRDLHRMGQAAEEIRGGFESETGCTGVLRRFAAQDEA